MAYIWLDNPRKNQDPVSSMPARAVINNDNLDVLYSQSTQLEEAIRNGYTPTDEEKVWLNNAYELLLKNNNNI
jgi:hypothetical protein